jgi:hypothetical protein
MTSAPQLETITLGRLRLRISVVVGQPTAGTGAQEMDHERCRAVRSWFSPKMTVSLDTFRNVRNFRMDLALNGAAGLPLVVSFLCQTSDGLDHKLNECVR